MAQTTSAFGSDSIGTKFPNWFLGGIMGLITLIGGGATAYVTSQITSLGADIHKIDSRLSGLEQRVADLGERMGRMERLQDSQRTKLP